VKDGKLYTAGEDVLEGSTRELVFKACRDLSIPVVLEAPRLSERGSWQAAFVTSTRSKYFISERRLCLTCWIYAQALFVLGSTSRVC
jgi:hypothetical protein